MTTAASVSLAAVTSAALIASYCDIRFRTIPQWLVAFTSLAGLAAQTLASGWHGLFHAVEAGAFAFLILGVMYLAGVMGAGDVKLFAAISCAVGTSGLWAFARITGLLGALLAVFYLAVGAGRGGVRRTGLPYGVAIGAAGVITLVWFR